MKTLSIKEKIGILELPIKIEITSNNKQYCIECGCKITPKNNSGWERFTDVSGKTQLICKKCEKNDGIGQKVFDEIEFN